MVPVRIEETGDMHAAGVSSSSLGPLSSMENARVALGELLLGCRNGNDPLYFPSIVALLVCFPALARARFWYSPPLYHLVGKAGVTLDLVQLVYLLNPDAVSDMNVSDNAYPLHNACELAAPAEIIKFLIDAFPAAVRLRTDSENELPIHLAVCNGRTTKDALQLLLDAYPESIRAREGGGHSPLDLAFNYAANPALLEYLMDRSEEKSIRIGSKGGWPEIINLPPAVFTDCWTVVVPRIRHIQCDMSYFNETSTQLVLHHLAQTTVINELHLRLSGEVVHQRKAIWQSVMGVLSNNPRLRRIHVGIQFHSEERKLDSYRYDQDFANILHQRLVAAHSSDMQSLELESFALADAGACLTRLVRSTAQDLTRLQELKLSKIELLRNYGGEPQLDPGSWILGGAWRECRLQKISISSCQMDTSSLLALLGEFAYVVSLVDLEIWFQGHHLPDDETESQTSLDGDSFPEIEELNITSPIVHILNQGRLQSLTVAGPIIDASSICAALTPSEDRMGNPAPLQKCHILLGEDKDKASSVRAFSELFPENLLLQDVLLSEGGSKELESEKIAYYTALNRSGRAKLTAVHGPERMEELVTVLAEVNSNSKSVGYFSAYQIQFGLLRAAPSRWSTHS